MSYQEKAKQLKEKLAEQKKIFDAQDQRALKAKEAGQSDEECLKAAEPTTEENLQAKKLGDEIQELYERASELKDREDARALNESRMKDISQPMNRPGFGADPNNGHKSLGQEFTQSPEFKAWLKDIAPHGGIPSTKISSPRVEMKGLIYTTATSGGAFVRRDYAQNVMYPLRPLTIRDVITNLRTSSNLIEFVRETAPTRAADVVPEATATTSTGYSNAAKPEAAMAFEIVQASVKTIAVWIPATRQILDDVPQLESMIERFLVDDVNLALEDQIINGTGGTDFTGIENTSGLTPQAFSTDVLTTTRKARTTALITGRTNMFTGYLMNPYDWEALDLTKDAENRYYFGGPLSLGTKMLWGAPVIESEVIPQGTAYGGDLRQMVVWDREQATTRITDSHSDFFTHNMLAILTEGRYAFGVFRPSAIVKLDLLAGANS